MLPSHRDIIENAKNTDILNDIKDEAILDSEMSLEIAGISIRGALTLGRYIATRFKSMSTFNKVMTAVTFLEPAVDVTLSLADNGEAELPEYRELKDIIIALNEVPEVIANILRVVDLPDSSSEMNVFISRTRVNVQKVNALGVYIDEEKDTIKTNDLPKKQKKNPKDLGYRDDSILGIADSFNKVNKYLKSKLDTMRNSLQKTKSKADEIVVEVEKIGDAKGKENEQDLINKKKALMTNANALKFKAKLADNILKKAGQNIRFVREAISELESQYDEKVFQDEEKA